MDKRIELQSKLEEILGGRAVYFQPPASIRLQYPCIVYKVGNGDAKYADDKLYKYTHSYDVTYISKQPRIDMITTMLSTFQMCRLSTTYCSDNLYHYVFNLYY